MKIEFVKRSYGWWSVTLNGKSIINIDEAVERLFGRRTEIEKKDIDAFSKWICESNKEVINKYSIDEYELRNVIKKSLIDFLSRFQ